MKKYETDILSVRLSKEDINRIDLLANEKHLNRSEYVKYLIQQMIKKDTDDLNLLQASITNLIDKQNKLENNLELLTQYFNAYMIIFFAYHPEIENNEMKKTLISRSIKRQKVFDSYFATELFDNMESFFEKLMSYKLEENKNE